MKPSSEIHPSLLCGMGVLPEQMEFFPRFRYMGSKFRLLPWIHDTLGELDFETATDAFSGSGVVSYLLKGMGKQVGANDSLQFPSVLTAATVANSATLLSADDLNFLLNTKAKRTQDQFIQKTFEGIFYTQPELVFLDNLWAGIRELESPFKRAMALAAILRSAIKRQPRGLFTVSDPTAYQDGRRDLLLTLKEHFIEQVEIYNSAVFSNGKRNTVTCGDVYDVKPGSDLVYMDPPYVPLADDNCYIKRYHFLEGLACYWEGKELMMSSKVRKIVKPFTPFSYRKTAIDAFDRLFKLFADSTLVLSYSSNAYPDLDTLRKLMGRYKRSVEVLEKTHRYHFGTHQAAKRNVVQEYSNHRFMKRVRQTFEEISDSLTNLEVDWMEDPHAGAVIKAFQVLPTGRKITREDVVNLLASDFRVGCTALRLFLDFSKDEFTRITSELFKDLGGAGVTSFRKDPDAFVAKLEEIQILERMTAEINRPPLWSDRLVGLFQGGWGSAVKGQLRGRMLEDFTEEILKKVFAPEQIIPRCQFLGANGLSSEKADFAIPSADDAHILIEVKAFNATGSKQTDVLGDIFRIVEQKRDDTAFILVTDGISWKARSSDLRKIINLQNLGKIRKIYTMAMAKEFEADLRSLKKSF